LTYKIDRGLLKITLKIILGQVFDKHPANFSRPLAPSTWNLPVVSTVDCFMTRLLGPPLLDEVSKTSVGRTIQVSESRRSPSKWWSRCERHSPTVQVSDDRCTWGPIRLYDGRSRTIDLRLLARDCIMQSALYAITRPSVCHTGGSVKNG